MFGRRITLFKLLGFEVHIDMSWLILAAFITWSLALGVFPAYYKDLPPATYWWMGAAGALGLFFSIIFHELFHSLVARRFGLPMKGITLFIFGGVAEMDEEPPGPRAEFLMAIAGPLSSIALGAAFYAAAAAWGPGRQASVAGVLRYLAIINWTLAGFNLVPAYPLDGGRVLRSALWQWKKSLRRATRIASKIGAGFGVAIIVFGAVNVLIGNFIGGLWQAMIGLFLRSAAQMSYQQVLIRRALEGEKVERFMNREPVTVPPAISLRDLVEKYIYRYHFKMFPVIEHGELVGCITTRQVKEVLQEQWGLRTVGDVAARCSGENTVGPDMDALHALSLMSRTGNSRLMVVDKGRLAGVITLKDIMSFLSVKLELGEKEDMQ